MSADCAPWAGEEIELRGSHGQRVARHPDGAQAERAACMREDAALVLGRGAAQLHRDRPLVLAPRVDHPARDRDVRRRQLVPLLEGLDEAREARLRRLDPREVVKDALLDAQGARRQRRAGEDVEEAVVAEGSLGREGAPVGLREEGERQAERRCTELRIAVERGARARDVGVELCGRAQEQHVSLERREREGARDRLEGGRRFVSVRLGIGFSLVRGLGGPGLAPGGDRDPRGIALAAVAGELAREERAHAVDAACEIALASPLPRRRVVAAHVIVTVGRVY